MPLNVVSGDLESHPLAELQYVTETRSWNIDGVDLNLTTLKNVELSIDRVIEWLESRGVDACEIESLAPYFGVVWPSAIALCAYLRRPGMIDKISGKKIIELGCGLALPSILCSKAGGTCISVDNHPNVPRFLRQNVAQNEPVHLTLMSPSDVMAQADGFGAGFDLVLASDVLYDRNLVKEFVAMICRLVSPHGRCVITDPGRAYVQEFVTVMNEHGWVDELSVWTVPAAQALSGKCTDIFVLEFRRA